MVAKIVPTDPPARCSRAPQKMANRHMAANSRGHATAHSEFCVRHSAFAPRSGRANIRSTYGRYVGPQLIVQNGYTPSTLLY